ncbi:MAG: hypothetical protein WC121_08520 [Candidatus Kapaibacterium sp.]
MFNLPFEVFNQHEQTSKAHSLYPTTHSLIKHYSDKYKDHYRNAIGTKRLIKLMKTTNFNKLYNKRKEWDQLNSSIPIEYLTALGITEKLLATAVEIDQEIYDKRIEEPVTYSGFVHPIRTFIVKSFIFNEPLTEREAVEKIKQMLAEEMIGRYNKRTYFKLDRSPYYSLCVNDEGKEWYVKNRPEYKIDNQYYVFRLPFFSGIRFK